MNQNNQTILAIESAISGGSIALLEGSTVTAEMAGNADVSRAEDILPNIDHLLAESHTHKSEIDAIAVSLGPGSYTGLRIGLSTVMGLTRGLGIEHIGIDLLQAIDSAFGNMAHAIAIPIGRSDICIWERESAESSVHSDSDLPVILPKYAGKKLLVHPHLSQITAFPGIEAVEIGTNLARYVGLAAGDKVSTELNPIYLKNPRFG